LQAMKAQKGHQKAQAIGVARAATTRFLGAVWAKSALAAIAASPPAAPEADLPPMRLAFTSRMFSEVSENDIKAAIKAWTQTLFKEHGIAAEPVPKVYEGADAVGQALRSNQVDAIAMTTDEYWTLSKAAAFDRVVVNVRNGSVTEEYLLLTRQDSPIKELAELKGRTLAVLRNHRTSLAPVWLDTLLVDKGLRPATEFFGRIQSHPKVSRAVLAVFFGQCEACLVTRQGLETMAELNPQVGRQLKALATSPKVVPSAFYFSAQYASPLKTRLITELERIQNSAAGQQVLTVFQSERVEERPLSCLDSARELLDKHRRTCCPPPP
jgi:ABC-type phosphate/phosphonate transport system substrate-binding protein